MARFRSTPPRGGRRVLGGQTHEADLVSIHAPARGATRLRLDRRRGLQVSIHAPARGATEPMRPSAEPLRFRSTPPRGGRRLCRAARPAGGGVSIHAPARGATGRPLVLYSRQTVSIHAPARGATVDGAFYRGVVVVVSIHAPARGATMLLTRCEPLPSRFRSTPPRGGRRPPKPVRCTLSPFRSTPPRGGRRPTRRQARRSPDVSIHAPARGATNRAWCAAAEQGGFDPRPREGGDPMPSCATCGRRCFDPRPREGGDPSGSRGSPVWPRFRSTPPRGGRPLRRPSARAEGRVSIHAPARGATRAFSSPGDEMCSFDPRPREGGDAGSTAAWA